MNLLLVNEPSFAAVDDSQTRAKVKTLERGSSNGGGGGEGFVHQRPHSALEPSTCSRRTLRSDYLIVITGLARQLPCEV